MKVLDYLKTKKEYSKCPVELINYITERGAIYGSYECCIDDIEDLAYIANATMLCDRTTHERVQIYYICDIEWYSEIEISEAVNRAEKSIKEKLSKIKRT